MSTNRRTLTGWTRVGRHLAVGQVGILYVWAGIIVLFAILEPSTFLRVSTAQSILNENAIAGLVALGLTVPLVTGVFDLSIGNTVGLTGVAAGALLQSGLAPGLVICVGLGIGLLIGAANAAVVVGFKVDSFIGTLASGSIIAAVTVGISNGQIYTANISTHFGWLGNQPLFGLTLPVYYMAALAIILVFVLEQTVTGRFMYGTGFNAEASRLAGVRVARLRVIAFLVSGVTAGFAGLVLTSNLASASPAQGPEYLLPAFAACFVGATSFRRGRFNALGTFTAVLLLGTGSVGILLSGLPIWAPDVFQGAVLIAAVAVSGLSRRALGRRQGRIEDGEAGEPGTLADDRTGNREPAANPIDEPVKGPT